MRGRRLGRLFRLTDERSDGFGCLGPFVGPGGHFFQIQLHGIGLLFRIVHPDLIEESAVAAHTGIRDDDAIIRAVLGAFAAESDDDGHNSMRSGAVDGNEWDSQHNRLAADASRKIRRVEGRRDEGGLR